VWALLLTGEKIALQKSEENGDWPDREFQFISNYTIFGLKCPQIQSPGRFFKNF